MNEAAAYRNHVTSAAASKEEFSGLAQFSPDFVTNDATVQAKASHVGVHIQRVVGLTDRLSILADKLLGERGDKGHDSAAPTHMPTVGGEMGVLTSALYDMDERLDLLGGVVARLEQLA